MVFNIRNKFLVPMVVLVLLGMGISSFLSYRLSKSALEESKIDQITQTAEVTASIIRDWFDNRKLDTSNWAKQDIFKTALKNNFLGKAARKTANSNFIRLYKEYKTIMTSALQTPQDWS